MASLFFKNKKSFNLFLAAILLAALGFWGYNYWKNQSSVVKIGLITDAHCYSKMNNDTKQWEVNWRCTKPMNEFVKMMNEKFKPDFVISLGDMVDGRDRLGEDGLLKAREMYEKIKFSKYYVLGNHETDNFTKDRWKEIVGHDDTKYYFDLEGYRFIVLDANNVQNLDNPEDIMDMSPTTPHSYKGLMDRQQMIWLEDLLKKSDQFKKVVFIHEPPLDQTTGKIRYDMFIDAKPLRELFSKYKVLAVFSGHIEELCDVNVGGVRYFTMKGFHKENQFLNSEHQMKDEGNFYQVKLKGDEIEIEMFHSEKREKPYQSVILSQKNIVCNNQSIPDQD